MSTHLTEEEIAQFIEGRYGEIDRARVYAHLRLCKQCFAEYQNAARFRGIWTSTREFFESPQDLVDAGMRLASKSSPNEQIQKRRSLRSRLPSGRSWRIALVGILAVLVFSLVWFTNLDRGELFRDIPTPRYETVATLDFPDIIGPIRTAADWVSSHTSIVFPGSEFSFDPKAPTYRSDFAFESDSISSSLLALVDLYEKNPESRDVLFWLTEGFLATGQLAVAQTYVKEARILYPADTDFILLSALVEYFEGNIEASEELLRGVLASDQDSATALMNLGVILNDKNQSSEAHAIFEKIQTIYPNTPIAERAQLLSED